jgi:enterochelin esterase family protein
MGMTRTGGALLLAASVCSAQDVTEFRLAEANVWGAQYPRVDGTGRVELRIEAPEALKVRVNFWSGPKADMQKQPDDQLVRDRDPRSQRRSSSRA